MHHISWNILEAILAQQNNSQSIATSYISRQSLNLSLNQSQWISLIKRRRYHIETKEKVRFCKPDTTRKSNLARIFLEFQFRENAEKENNS